MKFAEFLRTPNLKNICDQPTTSLIWNMAYKFTLSFFSILHIPKQILKLLLFMFHSLKFIALNFRQWGWFWTYLSKDYLCFIYFDVMTCKQQKKSSSCWTFFQSCEWSKNMWYCAITDNVHAQWSYLTVAQLTDVEWRSVLKVH